MCFLAYLLANPEALEPHMLWFLGPLAGVLLMVLGRRRPARDTEQAPASPEATVPVNSAGGRPRTSGPAAAADVRPSRSDSAAVPGLHVPEVGVSLRVVAVLCPFVLHSLWMLGPGKAVSLTSEWLSFVAVLAGGCLYLLRPSVAEYLPFTMGYVFPVGGGRRADLRSQANRAGPGTRGFALLALRSLGPVAPLTFAVLCLSPGDDGPILCLALGIASGLSALISMAAELSLHGILGWPWVFGRSIRSGDGPAADWKIQFVLAVSFALLAFPVAFLSLGAGAGWDVIYLAVAVVLATSVWILLLTRSVILADVRPFTSRWLPRFWCFAMTVLTCELLFIPLFLGLASLSLGLGRMILTLVPVAAALTTAIFALGRGRTATFVVENADCSPRPPRQCLPLPESSLARVHALFGVGLWLIAGAHQLTPADGYRFSLASARSPAPTIAMAVPWLGCILLALAGWIVGRRRLRLAGRMHLLFIVGVCLLAPVALCLLKPWPVIRQWSASTPFLEIAGIWKRWWIPVAAGISAYAVALTFGRNRSSAVSADLDSPDRPLDRVSTTEDTDTPRGAGDVAGPSDGRADVVGEGDPPDQEHHSGQ